MDVNTSKKSVLQIGNTIIWDVDLGEDENWQPEFHATVLYDGDDKPYRAAITRQWCEKYASDLDYITLLRTLKMFAAPPATAQQKISLSNIQEAREQTSTSTKVNEVRSYLAKLRKR